MARIEALYLLRDLFGRICITTTVRNELFPVETTFADSDLLAQALNEDWIDVAEVPPSNDKPLNPGVDAGKASSIQVAKQWQDAGHAVLMVMDDRAGRLEAKRRGLTLIGSAAVIGLAKTQGLIPAARPLLEQMVAAGYFIGPSVVSVILTNVAE